MIKFSDFQTYIINSKLNNKDPSPQPRRPTTSATGKHFRIHSTDQRQWLNLSQIRQRTPSPKVTLIKPTYGHFPFFKPSVPKYDDRKQQLFRSLIQQSILIPEQYNNFQQLTLIERSQQIVQNKQPVKNKNLIYKYRHAQSANRLLQIVFTGQLHTLSQKPDILYKRIFLTSPQKNTGIRVHTQGNQQSISTGKNHKTQSSSQLRRVPLKKPCQTEKSFNLGPWETQETNRSFDGFRRPSDRIKK